MSAAPQSLPETPIRGIKTAMRNGTNEACQKHEESSPQNPMMISSSQFESVDIREAQEKVPETQPQPWNHDQTLAESASDAGDKSNENLQNSHALEFFDWEG